MAYAAKIDVVSDPLDEIERYIANPPATSVLMELSPDVAKALLEKYNTENRGLKPHKIRPLVGDLRDGAWLVTGETIKFSRQRLLDGQNRLTACVEANTPIRTHVVFGIDDAAFAIIDTGAPRTAGDVLACAGVGSPQVIAHAVARLNAWEQTPGSRSVLRLSPNQVLHLYQTKYKDLDEHIGWGRQLQAATGLPTTRGLVLHYAFTKAAGQKAADAFLSAWISGDPDAQQAALLRRRLAQLQSMLAGNIPANVAYAMAIKAFTAFVNGKPIDVGQIKWSETEPMPSLKRLAAE